MVFTLIKQHNIGHPTPEIKLHYIKEILDRGKLKRPDLMHSHLNGVGQIRGADDSRERDREREESDQP